MGRVAAALLLLAPAVARAQVPAPPPGWAPRPYAVPPPVDLVSTEPGVSLSVFPERARPDRDPPLFECPTPPCRIPLWPGRYQLRVSEGPETLEGTRGFETTGPAQVSVDPDTHAHRTAGLVMGIVGPIAALVGVGMLASCSGSECREGDDFLGSSGVLLFLGGLTVTPIGWVMFGTSYKPEVEVSP
ncbi:MAG: hypothetical protein L6Q84_28115 [Polyangiaceae bacterium]|nr:hypothetical protein [Polyangiaceae bacterium]